MTEKIILLVEDSSEDEELIIRSLRRSEIANEIVIARDGVEALDFLFREGKFADVNDDKILALVMLDLKLPKMNGIEVLKRMRDDPRTKLIPVVVLTSSSEEDDMLKSYLFGANSYVRKPVDYLQFATAINKLGVFWLLYNQEPPRN